MLTTATYLAQGNNKEPGIQKKGYKIISARSPNTVLIMSDRLTSTELNRSLKRVEVNPGSESNEYS